MSSGASLAVFFQIRVDNFPGKSIWALVLIQLRSICYWKLIDLYIDHFRSDGDLERSLVHAISPFGSGIVVLCVIHCPVTGAVEWCAKLSLTQRVKNIIFQSLTHQDFNFALSQEKNKKESHSLAIFIMGNLPCVFHYPHSIRNREGILGNPHWTEGGLAEDYWGGVK